MAALTPLLRSYDQVILDLDGCVWVGDEAVPGSVEAIGALREAGKRVAFATNNGWHAGEDHVAKLWGIGVQASLADVVTVGGAMQHLLAEGSPGASAFVIGTQAMRDHVAGAGLKVMNGTDLASRADVVVLSGTDDLNYSDLRDATLAVGRGAALLATGRDPTLPMPDGHWPGTGAISRRSRRRRGGRPRSWASPRRACSRPRSTGSATAAPWWWATGWTPTSRPRPRPAWTPRWCSRAASREEVASGRPSAREGGRGPRRAGGAA